MENFSRKKFSPKSADYGNSTLATFLPFLFFAMRASLSS
jgi:hypothetical protein